MALKGYSAFNYGHSIDNNNRFINFSEGGPELTCLVSIGSYTLQTFANAIATALNSVGAQEYDVTVDRDTRQLTITAPGNFELLISSGTNKTISAYVLMGFSGADLVASDSYTGNEASGSQYITQTPLLDYTPFELNQVKTEAVVRKTSSGINEVIVYATDQIMKCAMPAITDITPQRHIRTTATGVQEAREFLEYVIGKNKIEFMPSIDDMYTYTPCLLQKTSTNSKGVGFWLKPRKKLAGYYEIKGLEFIQIEV